jgi:hypothetical protein
MQEVNLSTRVSMGLYTVGRTPWTEDQPVARSLPAHRTAQTPNKRTDIHASSGIRTHDPSVREGEDSSCLRPRCHCDRLFYSKNKIRVTSELIVNNFVDYVELYNLLSQKKIIIKYNPWI